MPTATKAAPKPKALPNIFDRAVCISVQMGCLGASKKVNVSQIEVDADKRFVAVSKRLFTSPEYDKIKACQTEIRQYLYSRSVPAEMLRGGFYMVSLPVVPDIDNDLEGYKSQLADLAKLLSEAYADIQEKDKERLRSLYDPRNYPSVDKLLASIYLDWQWISFGTPDSLPADIRSKEAEKAAAKIQEAANSIQQLLRAEMAGLVDHMVNKLTGERDGGKPKIFRDSLVTNLREFLKFFRDRNITDDAELEALTTKANALLEGVDPQALRDSDQMRRKVADGFAEVKATLDTLLIDRPVRNILLEEEEGDK